MNGTVYFSQPTQLIKNQMCVLQAICFHWNKKNIEDFVVLFINFEDFKTDNHAYKMKLLTFAENITSATATWRGTFS